MGAEFNSSKVKAKTKEELKTAYENLVSNALYDYGHSGYSGSIAESTGLIITTKVMTEEEAEEYIEETAKKWGDSIAVKIKDAEDTWLIGGVYSS